VDNLVLIRVAAALDRELRQVVLREAREEGRHRFRLLFAGERRVHSVLVSLRPELPWIGRPCRRWSGPRGRQGKFAAAINRALQGTRLAAVDKPTPDRWVSLRFVDGQSLIAELATHGANLVLLDRVGKTVAAARSPRKSRERLVPGQLYRPAPLPGRMFVPFGAEPAAIDRILDEGAADDSAFELLRRRLFGIGSPAAALVLDEAPRLGLTPGAVLAARLGELREGRVDPVIEAAQDPLEAAERGALDLQATRLLPWEPLDPDRAASCRSRPDAAATAGWFHEAVERGIEVEQRLVSLRSLLQREIERLGQAERKVAADLTGFEDPERHRRWGEAILAGLARVRRIGELLMVPDPYDFEGPELAVPARPGITPQQVAEEHFQQYRRARRGLEQARRRAAWLAERKDKLEEIAWAHANKHGQEAISALESAMREQSIPVGLEPATRAGRLAARRGRPRLEGVRVFTSSLGTAILVGRTGPANHRLTFKLASPEDFWLHAQGCPGAHVVIRNNERKPRPVDETLREAAALAAWYSDARDQEFADVQWTRRKYVRRPRGAAAGSVLLKRFETVRVRPGRPPTVEDWE
jgi:predicted ribosome quality control (RQC) complex YloA/Tae2 family protein